MSPVRGVRSCQDGSGYTTQSSELSSSRRAGALRRGLARRGCVDRLKDIRDGLLCGIHDSRGPCALADAKSLVEQRQRCILLAVLVKVKGRVNRPSREFDFIAARPQHLKSSLEVTSRQGQ